MVFFSAVFAARSPAMGNSADRAWQLSQLAEGVLTAFNPSHGSLSYVQARHCVSKQIGQHDVACQDCPRCVSRSPVLGTPQSRRALWGEEQRRSDCAFVLARKRKIRSLLRRGRRARRARFPTCGVIRVAGYSVVWDLSFPPPLFPLKSTKRSAAAISRPQRSFITFHGALRNILLSAGFPAMFHMIALEQTFVNGSLQKFFLLLLPFQIESIQIGRAHV